MLTEHFADKQVVFSANKFCAQLAEEITGTVVDGDKTALEVCDDPEFLAGPILESPNSLDERWPREENCTYHTQTKLYRELAFVRDVISRPQPIGLGLPTEVYLKTYNPFLVETKESQYMAQYDAYRDSMNEWYRDDTTQYVLLQVGAKRAPMEYKLDDPPMWDGELRKELKARMSAAPAPDPAWAGDERPPPWQAARGVVTEGTLAEAQAIPSQRPALHLEGRTPRAEEVEAPGKQKAEAGERVCPGSKESKEMGRDLSPIGFQAEGLHLHQQQRQHLQNEAVGRREG